MKYSHLISILILSISAVGCAVSSGLQTHDIPSEGIYTTKLGTTVNVVRLTQDTLPVVQPNNLAYNSNITDLFSNKQYAYQLNAGDVLSIHLWAHPEISSHNNFTNEQSAQINGYPLDHAGYIQLPLAGRYKAAGKTLAQVNRELRNIFARYLKNPDVVVRIISYEGQRYSVQGSVNKAGQFNLNDQPTSIYTALSLAGGINDRGDNTYIQLIRNGITYNLNAIELEHAGYSLHKLLILPNDTIYVSNRENQKVYVLGESGRNQALSLREQGMYLSDALGESLGINPLSASAARIYVIRSNQEERSTSLYHLDLSSLGDFSLANQFKLRRNDIIYVDASGLARWQRVVNQIIPFSNALYNLDRLGN
ncbi:polysaccharide biosynthesis/export family protein [Acinetobacter indicus]|uniref:Soluble ligand binding domain-containing protein n=1 Tax=Acinetobacter indicus TaxID=756892 RepID=A0A6C0Y5W2_9GAMM|nr:polysaccharide biosynthesis/export family protein [Acinetobacter indicus]QIC71528.1 hypothetical protein FSC09_14555 [Acinetobacter indicus]